MFYRFTVDQEMLDSNLPIREEKNVSFTEDDFRDSVLTLSMIGPDAMFRMALRKK